MNLSGFGWGPKIVGVLAGLLGAIALAWATGLGPFEDDSHGASAGPIPIGVFNVAQKQSSPELTTFVARADAICNTAYWKGVSDGRAVDRLAKEQEYSRNENAAAWQYAQAGSMLFQYRELLKLGEAPDRPELVNRWIETSKERGDLERAYAASFLNGTAAETSRLWRQLRYAKYRADQLAAQLPFRTCGTPWHTEWAPPGAQAETSVLQLFTSRLPLDQRALVPVGTEVYAGQDVAGKVTNVAENEDCAVVTFRIQRDHIRDMAGGAVGLYQSDNSAYGAWFAIQPAHGTWE